MKRKYTRSPACRALKLQLPSLAKLVARERAAGRPADAAAIAGLAGCSKSYAWAQLRALAAQGSIAPDGAPLRFIPLEALA